jgi:hypothetical protein
MRVLASFDLTILRPPHHSPENNVMPAMAGVSPYTPPPKNRIPLTLIMSLKLFFLNTKDWILGSNSIFKSRPVFL